MASTDHTVVVLKDVPVKYLVLMLEYIYCGQVDLEADDVREFNEVAKSLKINVEFKVPGAEEDTNATVSSTNQDRSMSLLNSDESIEASFGGLKTKNKQSKPLTISSFTSLSSKGTKRPSTDTATVRQNVPKKKLKRDMEREKLAKAEGWPKCDHCNNVYHPKHHLFHQKHCWENPNRIVSDCKICGQKFDIPAYLRTHMDKNHPGVDNEDSN